MPSKTVQPIAIELGIKGGEKLAALNRSFRDLSKQTKLSDRDIIQATRDIVKFAKEVGNSEATIKGQIKAFEGLREQAAMGGKAYRELGTDIQNLKASLKGATVATQLQAQSFSLLGKSSGASVEQISKAIKGLEQLRKETRLDSEAFVSFGKDIAELTQKLKKAEAQTESLAQARKRSSQGLGGGSVALGQRIRDSKLLVDQLRAEQQLAEASKAKFGASSLFDKGAESKGRSTFEDAVAGAALGLKVKDILTPADLKSALGEGERIVADYQAKIEQTLKKGVGASFQQAARSARESSRVMAAAFADPELLNALSNIDKRLGSLPETTAGYSQKLRELEQQLANTAISSDKYVAVALRIAQVQREATATAQGLGAALVKDLASGNTVRNQKNLREAIGQLQAEMNELNTETAEGSSKYAENARQVNNLQKELDEIAGSYRNVTDMARQASAAQGVYANTSVGSNYLRRGIVRQQEAARAELGAAVRAGVASTPLLLPAAGGTTSTGPGTTRRVGISREVIRGAPAVDVTSPAVGMSEPIKKQANALREAAAAYKPYNAEIRKAKAANNGSISGINNLRTALERKRNELPATTAAFKRLTQQIEILDRQSEKASRRMSRRKFSPGKAAQVAGATISGGIFGGPEGFLGGAIGGALGGVGGSFAGAALGAQVGQLRQQLGGFAEYAASIEKLKIALNGIAGDASNYNRALQAAADVTKELNIPQEVAIRGITRLTAAVKGAGGNVNDASIAFKNINSAIIATGGGAEQVEGAVTALVQIFSKGKVSAEEINQIAERLPGTFNLFAEAAGKTGPQLADSLKKGEVGLNDLQKFVKLLGDDFGDLAEKIADSPQAAGARLKVVTDQLRKDIGDALQPIGAEFQQAFAEFISDIGPDLVKTAKAVGEGMSFIVKNRGAIKTIADLVTKLLAANLAIKGLIALKGPSRLMLLMLQNQMGATAVKSRFAAKELLKVKAVLGSLALIGIVSVGIDIAITGFNQAKSAFAEIKRLRAEAGMGGASAVFAGADRETVINAQKTARQSKKAIEKEQAERQSIFGAKGRLGQAATGLLGPFAGRLGLGLYTQQEAGSRAKRLDLRLKSVESTLALPVPEEPKKEAQTVFPGGDLLEETNSKSGGGGGKAEKVRKSLLDSIINEGKLIAATKARLDNEIDIGEAQNKNNRSRVNQLNNQRISIDFAEQAAQVELKYLEALKAAEGQKEQGALVAEAIATKQNDDARLSIEYAAELTKEAQRYRFEKEAIAKASEDELFNLRDQLGLVSNEQRIERFRQSRKDAGDPNAEQQTDLFRQTIDPTLTEGLSQNIRSLKKELEDLVNPINQITGAANAIGSAFSQSFTDAISGSKSAKEALADFFKSVGSYFLDMAGQIIAKMITISILNAVTGLLPGGGGFNLESTSLGAGGGEVGGIGTLGPNFGIAQRATGGPVTANKPYIVGERGLELMIPSTSGRVLSNSETRQQLNNQQAATSTREQLDRQRAFASTREQLNNQQAKAMQPLDIRYESTVINNVEYVTAEQHRQGMAQAAERGRSLTLSALQGSVKTRKKVGLS
jgi:tape measure domain-containing protein